MYDEHEQFDERRDCQACNRLLGQKIVRVWCASAESTGLNIQWECDGCHCRMFEYLDFASNPTVSDWNTCEFCGKQVPAIILYRSQKACNRCLKIIKEMYMEGGGE